MNLNWNSEFVRFLWIGRQGRYCYNWVFVIGTERFKSGVGGLPSSQQRPTSRRPRTLPLLSVNPHTHSAFIPYFYFICVKGFDVDWWEVLISERKGENKNCWHSREQCRATSGEYGYRPGPCQIRSEEIYVHLLLCSEEFYVKIEVGRWIEDCSLWLSRECEGTFKSQMISSGFISVGIYTCTQ